MKIVAIVVLIIVSGNSFAEINAKNGDFAISYADVVLEKTTETEKEKLTFDRTYNSLASREGWFGVGWGSVFETRIERVPFGYEAHMIGSGAIVSFYGKDKNKELLNEAISKLAEYSGVSASEDSIRNDEQTRNRLWVANKAKMKKYTELLAPDETLLTAVFYGDYYTLRVLEEYVELGASENEVYRFDKDTGVLLSYANEDARVLVKKVNDDLLVTSSSGLNYTIRFGKQKTKDGYKKRVFRLESDGNEVAEYKYNDSGQLIESIDAGNNVYKYAYDAKHNLVEIRYADGTKMKLGYNTSSFMNSVTYRDNKKMELVYHQEQNNPYRSYSTFVTKYQSDGTIAGTDYFYYELEYTSEGRIWLKRARKSENYISAGKDSVVDVKFNECCGLPVQIHYDNDNLKVEYDLTMPNMRAAIKKISEIGGDGKTMEFVHSDGELQYLIYGDGSQISLQLDEDGEVTSVSSPMPDKEKIAVLNLFNRWYEIIRVVTGCKCLYVPSFK